MEEDISAASLFASNLIAFKQVPIAADSIGLGGPNTSSSSVSGTGSDAAAVTTSGANSASAVSSGSLILAAAAAMVVRIFAIL